MDILIQHFHSVITYPVLNLFICLYEQTHSFSLTIVLLTCITQICLVWPARYLTAQGKEHKSQLQLLYGLFPRLLSYLNIYVTYGMYFMLAVLGGSSLQALNKVLYAPVEHLSILPNYNFSLFGQTISLVHPGMAPGFLIIITLTTLANAYLIVRKIYRVTELRALDTIMEAFTQGAAEGANRETPQTIHLGGISSLNLGCTFLIATFIYPLSAGLAIIFAYLFAAGTLLAAIAFSSLEILANFIMYVWTYRPHNYSEATN
jgi:hypothetical protein